MDQLHDMPDFVDRTNMKVLSDQNWPNWWCWISVSCHVYVSTFLPIPIMLEEVVPEEAVVVADHSDHVLDDQDHHDVQSDPFVVVEESQVVTCVSFLFLQRMPFTLLHLKLDLFHLKLDLFHLKLGLFQKTILIK